MGNLGLQAPWVTFAEEVKEFFKEDPDIKIEYKDDNPYEIKLFVEDSEKADALMKLIPAVRMFGNITFKVTIIPADEDEQPDVADLFEKAFAGNPVLSFVVNQDDPAVGPTATYVVFANKVVQFYNDDLSDYYRNKSTLYQEIASDVFGDVRGVYFNTDIPKEENDDEDEFDEESGADE